MLAKAHTEIESKKSKREILLPNRVEKVAKSYKKKSPRNRPIVGRR